MTRGAAAALGLLLVDALQFSPYRDMGFAAQGFFSLAVRAGFFEQD